MQPYHSHQLTHTQHPHTKSSYASCFHLLGQKIYATMDYFDLAKGYHNVMCLVHLIVMHILIRVASLIDINVECGSEKFCDWFCDYTNEQNAVL